MFLDDFLFVGLLGLDLGEGVIELGESVLGVVEFVVEGVVLELQCLDLAGVLA